MDQTRACGHIWRQRSLSSQGLHSCMMEWACALAAARAQGCCAGRWAVNHDKPMPEWVEPPPMTAMPTSLPAESSSQPHVAAHPSSGSAAQSASSEVASLLAMATADPFSQPAVQTASQSTSQSAAQSASQASDLSALKAAPQSSSQAPPQQASSSLNSDSSSSATVEPTPAQMGSGKQGLRKHRLRMRSMHHNSQPGS